MTKTLEFEDILKLITKYAHTDSTIKRITELKPNNQIDLVNQSLVETKDFLTMIERGSHCPLIDDFDIVQLFKYANKNITYSIYEFLQIRLFLSMEKDVISYIKYLKKLNISAGVISTYFDEIKSHYNLLESILDIIDLEGLIKDDASPLISRIRKDLVRYDKQLQEKLNKLVNDYQQSLSDHVIVMRNDRFCLCVKEQFKHKIRGITHDISASGQTVYIEPEQTRQITANIESLKAEEKNEINRLLYALSAEVQKFQPSLMHNLETFIDIDFIQSKALYAKSIDAIMPQINDNGCTSLINAKHPLLDQKIAVPISLSIDEKYKILLITGPNTGGKTVALKTLGLLTLMTQSGILIPASEKTQIAIFNQIFADIGDEQSIEQSLSTFSSHLTKIINMLKNVDDKTLIILDEIGSGTDPNEGVSLAIAMMNAFKKYDVRMLVTTHYAELKHYAFEQSDIQTASVAFDQESLKPLYYVQMGMTGSSQAFHIAHKLGLADDVINDAKYIYSNKQTDVAKMMDKLNALMIQNEDQKNKLEEQNKLLQEKINTYDKLRHDFIKSQDQVIENIKQKELQKWQSLQEEARTVIKELEQKQNLSKPESAKYKHQLKQGLEKEDYLIVEDELKKGDSVFIKSYQQYGLITQVKNDRYKVKFGNFELTFDINDLVKDKAPKKKKQTIAKNRKPKQENHVTPEKTSLMRLDLRGFRYEEVYEAIDKAVDQALLSGLHEITVIHGFGTGAVKNAVYAYINQSSLIKSHRFGREGEGLMGVTILTLK
jgi:DNA mismatch repair protein MutS2